MAQPFSPWVALVGALVMVWAGAVAAGESEAAAAPERAVEDAIVDSAAFLAAHPDLRWRKLGVQARRNGRPEQARVYFRRAAAYADKLSQAAYAQMLWNGEGGAVDRPAAYAWMDLAAQRGTPALLVQRERYWAQLGPSEREQALVVGERIYAEFGDRVAKPRQEREMRAELRKMTGSRTGAAGPARVCTGTDPGAFSNAGSADRSTLFGGGCSMPVSGEMFYADRYWQPDAYWRWQDEVLQAALSN